MDVMLLFFLGGSMVGSFLNVVIYRLPQKISVIMPSSFCPKCKNKIRFWANIPLLGYVVSRGKCHHCQQAISLQYPIVEFITGVLTAIAFFHFGLTIHFFIYSIFIYFLIVIAAIDIKTHLIYNKVLIALLGTGLVTQLIQPFTSWEQAVYGMVAGFVAMFFIAALGKVMFKKESLGMGDVKLAAVAGFFTGWLDVLIALYLGFVLAFIVMMIKNRVTEKPASEYIPLGPFLAGGLVIFLIWGQDISALYQKIIF